MEKQLRLMLAAQAIGAAIAMPFLVFVGYKIVMVMF